MSALANLLLKESLAVVLPMVAHQFATFAAENEPEVKAYLTAHFGDASPIVEEVFQLLIEPGLVTIGGLLTTIGGAAPSARPTSAGISQGPHAFPDYRDS